LTIDPPGLPSAKLSEPYQFKARVEFLPPDAKDIRLRWDFGDGTQEDMTQGLERPRPTVVQGSRTHQFEKAGNFTVRVQAIEGPTAKMWAEATIAVVMDKQPSVRFRTKDLHANTNVPIEMILDVTNPPAKAQYLWDHSYATSQPSTMHTFKSKGANRMIVDMYDVAAHSLVASAEATVIVEDGEQLKTVTEHGPDGKLTREYQVSVATWKQTGFYREYFPGGLMSSERIYKQDVVLRRTDYWPSGKQKLLQSYNDAGQPTGLQIAYHENGNKRSEEIWMVQADGKTSLRDGPSCEYFEDGELSIQAVYVAGQRHGPYKQWYAADKSGKHKLGTEGRFDHGQREGKWLTHAGMVESETEETYVAGLLEGTSRTVSPYGQTQVDWKNGKQVASREYNAKGELIKERKFP
jgi:antitoxin component YwqK of YwqJK toxin-antitoxin module